MFNRDNLERVVVLILVALITLLIMWLLDVHGVTHQIKAVLFGQ